MQNKGVIYKFLTMQNDQPSTNRFFPVKGVAEARQEGYKSLTRPYYLNHKDESIRSIERLWWNRLCDDLKSCRCTIVEFSNGVELWRHDDELDIDPMTGLKHSSKIDND